MHFMRNLKKIFSGLLVGAVVLTSMVPAFAATSYNYETQAKALYDLGLFKGVSTSEYNPDLGAAMDRETGVVMMLRLVGKIDEANALSDSDTTTALAKYTDADKIQDWAKKPIAYAIKNGLVIGTSDTSVSPDEQFIGKMFAAIILRNVGYDVTVANYDVSTSTMVEKGGLTAAEAIKFNDKDLIRDDMVGMSYGSLKLQYAATAKNIIETLVADGKVNKALAIQLGLIKETVQSVSAAQTGASKITVTFAAPVDTTKAVVTLKKGTVAVNTDSVVFAADNKSAVVTATTKLSKGDYTVSAAGVTDAALTATVTAQDEKVAKINITSSKAPRLASDNTKAKVSYAVLNQFGEALTGQAITWTVSTGVPVSNEVNNVTNASFEITAANGADFVPGAIVYITGVQAASGTVVNGQVEIALASQADSVTFKGVWDKTNSKLVDLPAGFAADRYVLLFTVNDQYGNTMSTPDLSKLVFTSNAPLFVDATSFTADTDVTIDNTTYKAVKLVPGTSANNGGAVTIQAISTVTGKISTFTVTANALSAVKTFTMSAPTDLVAEGETVGVPYTAIDQYGNSVTSFSALNGKVTLSPAYDGVSGLRFVQQDDATAKLEYTAPATGATKDVDLPVYLSSVVANGGSFSSAMLSVKEAAVPSAIVGIDTADISTSVAAYNYVDIYAKNLVIQDQYGRTIKDANVESWLNGTNSSIVVTSTIDTTPFTVKLNGTGSDAATQVLGASTDFVRIAADVGAAATTSTESIKFTLSNVDNGASVVDASAKTLTFTKVEKSAYVSYEVADPGLMFNDSNATTNTAVYAGYAKTLKVYGVKADGTKVLLPASDYTVSTGSKLAVTGNVISDLATGGYAAADFLDTSNNYQDVKVDVLVTVNDNTTGSAIAILTKQLVLSNKAPKVATVTLNTDLVTNGKAVINPTVADISAADLKAVIKKVQDQYGVDSTEAPVITITNLTKVTGSTFTVTGNGTINVSVAGAKIGDKFTVEFKYASGVTSTVDFTVGLPK
jgi:hypothetical protein